VRTSTKPAARGTRPLRRWAAAEDFFAQPRFGGRHPLILESCERPHAMDGRRYGGRAEFYEAFNEPMERGGLAAVRARMAGALSGRVLEIGCGTGGNFPYYPPAAEVTAIELLAEYPSALPAGGTHTPPRQPPNGRRSSLPAALRACRLMLRHRRTRLLIVARRKTSGGRRSICSTGKTPTSSHGMRGIASS
jgi:hypothetical protein